MKEHPHPQHLASYLDAEGTARHDQRLQRHVSVCRECRDTLEQLRAMRQAIRAAVPPISALGEDASFMAALNRRIRTAPPSLWHSACYGAPAALALAGAAAHIAIWGIFGGDALQRLGIAPQVGPHISTWAVKTATAPVWQRIVYEPLGLSEQDVALAVSDMMSPLQNVALRPMWAALIMILPLTLLFGVGILALSWLICWSGAGRRSRGE